MSNSGYSSSSRKESWTEDFKATLREIKNSSSQKASPSSSPAATSKSHKIIDCDEFLFFNENSSLTSTARTPVYLEELLQTTSGKGPKAASFFPEPSSSHSPPFPTRPPTASSPSSSGQQLPSFMRPLDQDVDLAWFDEQRRLFATYEYMCRIQEAKEWIEDTLADPIPSCASLDDFEERLRDGVLLCRLMRCFAPASVPKIFTAATLQFRHSDNLVYFWRGCEKLGLPPLFAFELVDLYDKKNIPKVIYCLHALSHLCLKRGLGVGVRSVQGKVIFDERDVRQKDAELALAGISMPAFNKVSQLIVEHLEQEKNEGSKVADLERQARERQEREAREREEREEREAREREKKRLEAATTVQSYVKRYLMYLQVDSQYLAAHAVQAVWRGLVCYDSYLFLQEATSLCQCYLKRRKNIFYLSDLHAANSLLLSLLARGKCRNAFLLLRNSSTTGQSLIRRHFARASFLTQKFSLLIQSLVRRNFWFKSFRRIQKLSPNLSLQDVFKFLNLFEVGNQLLLKEIELDQLRLGINKKINEIQEKEEHLSDLDVKVGLLLKNTLSLQDLIKETTASSSKQPDSTSSNSASAGNLNSSSKTLLGLDRDNHTKLKQYRQLFYLLQTDPSYLSEVLTEMSISKAKTFVEDCVLPLFGHGQSVNEEYLLLGLAKALIEKEVFPGMSTEDFMASDLLFVRICLNYARGAKEISYLKSLLGPLIDEIIGNDNLSFETDPINIYRDVIKQEEMENGQKSQLPFDVSREEAFQNVQVKEKYIENLKAIQFYSRKFITSIIASVQDVPYSIRFVMKQMFSLVQDQRLIGHFIYYRYLNPAIVSPETFDVLERPISSADRKNLAEISRMLQFIVLGKTFTFQDYSHLIPLNDYISQTSKAFSSYLSHLIDVPEPREHFSIPADVPLVESDYVYLSLHQIYKIHECLCCFSTSLKEIVCTLGNAPRSFLNDQSVIRIDLMKPRNLTVYQVDGHLTLLLHVKKFLLLVFGCSSRSHSEDVSTFSSRQAEKSESKNSSDSTNSALANSLSLVAFLGREASQEEENNFGLIFENGRLDEAMSVSSLPPEYLASLTSLKKCLMADVEKLEGFNDISRLTNYNGILIDFARDLRNSPVKNRYLGRELSGACKTLCNLEEKASALDSRIQAINEYVKNAIQVLSSNARPKKPLPFTKHYSHFVKLERQGKMPRFGSYKYSAADLYTRGIIYSIAEYSLSQYDKISIVIASNDPGVFVLEATLMGIKIPQTATVRLEDLLDCQFNNVQKMSLFGGIAKVNVNLLIHFLNKKFFE